MMIGYNYQSFFSSVNSDCDLAKLLNTITNSIGEGLSTMAARVGGGFIFEIPNYYLKIKGANTCFDQTASLAKIFSIVFDYYI
jgi:hypothetical protein